MWAKQILSEYSSKLESRVIADNRAADGTVMLEPRIIRKDNMLTLSILKLEWVECSWLKILQNLLRM